MNEKSKGLKRLTCLTIASMLVAGLWWTSTHSDSSSYTEEARRIIVYTTTS